MTSRTVRYLAKVAALATIYFAAGKLGLLLAFEQGNVSPVWPPTGIALAGLLVLGPNYWPAITLGAFLVNALTPIPSPFATSCGVALGNTLEAVLGAWLLRRLVGFHGSLDRLRDVLGLIFFAAMLSTMASSTIGMLSLCLGDPSLWGAFGRLWGQWWLGDAMGDLVIAPVLLTWCVHRDFREFSSRSFEVIALMLGIVGLGQIVFGGWFSSGLLSYPYWIFPLLIISALRFGQGGVASATLLISATAIGFTLRGTGPFAGTTPAQSLVLLQAFLGVTAGTGLVLAAVTTERRKAEDSLKRLNEELEQRVVARTAELAEVNRELSQRTQENEMFVYSVSHDLRSPLVNLQGFSKELGLVSTDLRAIVQDEHLPPAVQKRGMALLDGEMAESVHFIQSGVMRLNSIIDALLRLSRARRVEYHWQTVELAPIVRRIIESMHSTIVQRGAEVTTAELPPAWGDPTALEQIFANLIGNAVNYLDPKRQGRIEIGFQDSSPSNEANGQPVFRTFFVKDNGVGIAEAHRPKLFQAFQRLHPDMAKGEGIGLLLVSRMAERHSGKIWVDSTPGAGSTFFVTLPVKALLNSPTKNLTQLAQR